MADTNNAAWTRITLFLSSRPATSEMRIAGVTQPTIMATTCCRARGRALENAGMPSDSKIDAFVCDI